MVNQELLNYVKQQIEKGRKREEMKQELLGIGWQEKDIEETFKTLNINRSAEAPLPPSPPSPMSLPVTPEQQKLHPKAVWMFFFRFLGAGFILALFSSWFIAPLFSLFTRWRLSAGSVLFSLLLFFLIWFGFSYLWAKLSYKAYGYALTENGFKKELGVISKKYITIPYERIQNVDIHRGIIARILGLSDLRIQTAGYSAFSGRHGFGGGEAEGVLPGVSREVAEQLREELVKRAKGTKSGV